MDLTALLRDSVGREASDVHLQADRVPAFRIDGRLVRTSGAVLSADEVERLAQELMPEPRAAEFGSTNEADFGYEVPGVGRFRVNVFRQQGTVGIVMRYVRFEVRDIEALGLPPVVRRLAEEPRGLVLVTGRIGAGKTTTLAAMVDHINETRDGHILTIEDPVEIRHPDKRCMVSQRDVGLDTEGFHAALKRALRQDPDVILIGEMRDKETVTAALSAAETGHLVLSTLHTVNAVETVNRILDFFPPHQHVQVRASLAATLRGIVSQRLLPRANGPGQLPAVEVLVGTGRVSDRILVPDKTHELEAVIAEGEYYGMQTFDQHLIRLYQRGAITRAEAVGAATHPHDLVLAIDQVTTESAVEGSSVAATSR
ncbi:MAG: type IV pilus twitching motility protein PilT [Acidimicrobiia bacterium]